MLTDIQIRNLPIPDKRTHTLVNAANGLYVVRQPSGAKSFAAFPQVNGKQVKVTFGPYPAVSLKEANRKATEAKGKAAGGVDPGAEKREARAEKRAAQTTRKVARLVGDRVGDIVDVYVTNYLAKNCKPSWAKEAERILRVEVAPKFGKKRLGEIEDTDVHALLVEIAERAPRTSNLTFAVFRKLCNWAMSLEGGKLIKASPCVGVKALSGNNKRERVLSDEETRLVWRAAGKVGWPFGAIYRLALLTGARREEVAGMEWSELNLEQKIWMVPGPRTKNKKMLVLPLSEAAVEILRAFPRIGDSKFVFTTTTKTHVTGYSNAKDAIDKAMLGILREEMGDKVEALPQWQFHDLRRTLITNLQKLGVRLEVTEAILNHVSGASRSDAAGHYHLHAWTDEKRAALDMWARRLAEIVENAPPATNVVEIARARA
jgi:integrase